VNEHSNHHDQRRPHRPEPATSVYTCPMHPQIRQSAPGNCPICGMALEPLLPSLDADDNPELRDFSRRFWWTLPLTIVVTVLAMFGHQFGGAFGAGALLGGARPVDASCALGRLAVLRALRAVVRESKSEHVDADRHRRRRCLRLQSWGNARAGLVSRFLSSAWSSGRVLRGGGGDRVADAAWTGPRTEGAWPDLGCDQGASRACAKKRPANQPGWQRGRHPTCSRSCRRCPARAARRESSG